MYITIQPYNYITLLYIYIYIYVYIYTHIHTYILFEALHALDANSATQNLNQVLRLRRTLHSSDK